MNERLAQVAGAYREWVPVAALRGHLRCLWVNDCSDSPASSIQVVPDGCVDIIRTHRGLRVAGPDTRPVVEELLSPELFVGIRFHPGAAFAWLGVPLTELLNSRVPLTEFWGDDAERLAEEWSKAGDAAAIARGLERALLARLPQVGPADPGIAFLRRTAYENCDRGRLGIAGLASQTGWSERTLRRRSQDAFGYGLRTLGRIMRFQRLGVAVRGFRSRRFGDAGGICGSSAPVTGGSAAGWHDGRPVPRTASSLAAAKSAGGGYSSQWLAIVPDDPGKSIEDLDLICAPDQTTVFPKLVRTLTGIYRKAVDGICRWRQGCPRS